MLLSGRREADIARRGGREASDDEAGEGTSDGGDEEIYPEGQVAESTEEGCATDWHARAVLNVGVTWDYIVRLYGYFCVSTTVQSGTSGFRENGVRFCKGR